MGSQSPVEDVSQTTPSAAVAAAPSAPAFAPAPAPAPAPASPIPAVGPAPTSDVNAPDGHVPVEIDTSDSDETDSAVGSDGAFSETTTLASSIFDYRYENGRTYHAFHDGQYIMPNDDKEQERLDLVHHIWMLILRGRLYRSPIPKTIQRALDVGTGTGIWAMNFADEFPSATVIANDLSAIQPSWVPPNLLFEIDDVESEWTYNKNTPFEFIHVRNMGGSIGNWDKLCAQSLLHLAPGGWLEVQEHAVEIHSEDGDVPPNTKEMMEQVKEAAKMFGKELNVAESVKGYLINAGFEDVQEDVYKIPITGWAKDKRMKEIGRYQGVAAVDSLEAYTLALFTRVLGWELDRVHVFLAAVRAEMKDPRHHLYLFVYVVYGRKPSGP